MENAISTLISTVQQIQLACYFNVAILSIFVADYVHTSTTEISLLWPAPWSFVKIAFLISRYTPFLDGFIILIAVPLLSPPVDVCIRLVRAEIWSASIGNTFSQLLLIYRAYALLGRTRISAILLSGLGFALVALELATSIGFAVAVPVEGITEVPGISLPSIIPRCLVGEANKVSTSSLITIGPVETMAFETILFGVITWAKIKKYKEDRNQLIRKIYKDAYLYYLLLFLVSAGSLVMWFLTRGPIRSIPPAIPRYFGSIIASRIILNIREYANSDPTMGGTGSAQVGKTTQPVSRLRFAGGGQSSGVDTELRLP